MLAAEAARYEGALAARSHQPSLKIASPHP